MPDRLPPPGPSFLREQVLRVGDLTWHAGMSRPSVGPDDWWLAVLWVRDEAGIISFRDAAPAAGPPPEPPLARLGPAFSGGLSGLILEDGGRLAIRLGLLPPPPTAVRPGPTELRRRAPWRRRAWWHRPGDARWWWGSVDAPLGVRRDRRPHPPLRRRPARVLDRCDLVPERRLRRGLLDADRRGRGAVPRGHGVGPHRLPGQPLARPPAGAADGGRAGHLPGPLRAAGRGRPRRRGRPLQSPRGPAAGRARRAGDDPGPDPDRFDRPRRALHLRGHRHPRGGRDPLADRAPVDQPGAVRRRRRDRDRRSGLPSRRVVVPLRPALPARRPVDLQRPRRRRPDRGLRPLPRP